MICQIHKGRIDLSLLSFEVKDLLKDIKKLEKKHEITELIEKRLGDRLLRVRE